MLKGLILSVFITAGFLFNVSNSFAETIYFYSGDIFQVHTEYPTSMRYNWRLGKPLISVATTTLFFTLSNPDCNARDADCNNNYYLIQEFFDSNYNNPTGKSLFMHHDGVGLISEAHEFSFDADKYYKFSAVNATDGSAPIGLDVIVGDENETCSPQRICERTGKPFLIVSTANFAGTPIDISYFYPDKNSFVDLRDEWQGIFTLNASGTIGTPEPFESYIASVSFGTSTDRSGWKSATLEGSSFTSINEITQSNFPYINVKSNTRDMEKFYFNSGQSHVKINTAAILYGLSVDGGIAPISKEATSSFFIYYKGRTTSTQKFSGFDLFSELEELEPVLAQPEKDCSSLWGGIFSSSTLEAIYCIGEKLMTKTATFLFVPSTSTREYFFSSLTGLTKTFPLNLAFNFDKIINNEIDALRGDIIINPKTTNYDKLEIEILGKKYPIISSSSFTAKVGTSTKEIYHNTITSIGWLITGIIFISFLF